MTRRCNTPEILERVRIFAGNVADELLQDNEALVGRRLVACASNISWANEGECECWLWKQGDEVKKRKKIISQARATTYTLPRQ